MDVSPVRRDVPHILLVNPWIHDFAAYDFWAKPLGILTLAAILELHGFAVHYIDCLDRFHPCAPKTDPGARYGRGPYLKTPLPKPRGLEGLRRNFSRYGIKPEWFRQELKAVPTPDVILVTSIMTYWYPGVRETIGIIRESFHNVPVVLGGVYPTLCHDHAVKHAGADTIVTGPADGAIVDLLGDMTGFRSAFRFDPEDYDTYPRPAFHLQHSISYIPLLTSRGCPFACAYCASHILNPTPMRRNPKQVMEEIEYWHQRYGVMDFIFYDDALLVDSAHHARLLFEEIIRSGLRLRFHTPNAVHIREITKDLAVLMREAGFETLRLGLETTGFDNRDELDRKVTGEEFRKSVSYLRDAGFKGEQIGAYLLVGLPGQSIRSVEESIQVVKQSGITPILAHYTPIPGTRLWEKAVSSSRYDLKSDPLFTNNAVFPCHDETFSWKTLSCLKELTTG